MKTANRKMLLSLLGIAVATPFVGLALLIGARVSALGNSLQGELLVVVLALASLVAGIGEGRLVLKREAVPARRGGAASEGVPDYSGGPEQSDPRGVSQFHPGY